MFEILKKLRRIQKQVFSLFQINNCSNIVWKELITLIKKMKWDYSLYEKDKLIEISFTTEEGIVFEFKIVVSEDEMYFRSLIISEFNEDITNDMMVLASHFNNIFLSGVVKINTENNYVELYKTRDLLIYLLKPEEIYLDILRHYESSKECYRTFNNMINTGDEPVFIIADFVKSIKDE